MATYGKPNPPTLMKPKSQAPNTKGNMRTVCTGKSVTTQHRQGVMVDTGGKYPRQNSASHKGMHSAKEAMGVGRPANTAAGSGGVTNSHRQGVMVQKPAPYKAFNSDAWKHKAKYNLHG